MPRSPAAVPLTACATVLAAILAVGPAAALARSPAVVYKPCGRLRLVVRDTQLAPLPISGLRVHVITCAGVARAMRAASFEATPGGPLFNVPGFRCEGPVGPPPGAKPRYYSCSRQRQSFEFLVPGFS